jgi:hypothetical protein
LPFPQWSPPAKGGARLMSILGQSMIFTEPQWSPPTAGGASDAGPRRLLTRQRAVVESACGGGARRDPSEDREKITTP